LLGTCEELCDPAACDADPTSCCPLSGYANCEAGLLVPGFCRP
jgi:hypothetical protein